MATTPPTGGFDPNVQEQNAKTYTNDFRPVSDITADKSLGLAFEGAGKLVEGGINLADATAKDDASKQLRDGAEKIRTDVTNDLLNIKAGQNSTAVPGDDPAAAKVGAPNLTNWSVGTYDFKKMGMPGPDAPTNILPNASTTSVPASVDNAVSKATALYSALGDGHINDTYYKQRLDSLVTNVRSQYPGYRDYIDKQIEGITGFIPANALVKDLMEDVNRQATKGQEQQKERLSFLRTKDYVPGMDAMQQKYEANPSNELWNQIYASASKYDSAIQGLAARKAIRDDKAGTKTEQTASIQTDVDTKVAASVAASLNTYSITSDLASPTKFLDYMDKVRSGQAVMPGGPQMQQIGNGLKQAELSSRMRLLNGFYKDGTVAAIGLDAVNKSIDQGHKPYKDFIDSITDKDVGSAGINQRMADAYSSASDRQFLEDKDTGPFGLALGTLKRQGGDQFIPLLVPKMLGQGYDKKLGDMMAMSIEKRVKGLAQVNLNVTGEVRTVSKDMADADKKISDPETKAQMYDSFLDNLNVYTDPQASDTIKLNANKYFFDKDNIGKTLSYFKMDYKDPQTGEMIPGKYGAYSLLTSQKVVDTAWKLRDKDQSAWSDAKNFAEQSFALGLFQPDILATNEISKDLAKGNYNTWATPQNSSTEYHLAYNPRSTSFTMVDQNDRPITETDGKVNRAYVHDSQQILTRFNRGIQGVARFQEKEGGDVSGYVINLLQQAGFSPDEKTSGLPSQMMKAILASKPAPIDRVKQLNDYYDKQDDATGGGANRAEVKNAEELRKAFARIRGM